MTYRYGAWMYPELFEKPPKKVCALCDISFVVKPITKSHNPKQQSIQEKKPA
jgi:hypothetical protein